MWRSFWRWASPLVALVAAAPVFGAVEKFDQFTERSVFVSNLVNLGVEGFESFDVGATAPLDLNFVGAGVTGTLNVTGFGTVADPADPFSSKYWSVTLGPTQNPFEVILDVPQEAFGFSAAYLGSSDQGGALNAAVQVELTDNKTETITFDFRNVQPSSLFFFGVIAKAEQDAKIKKVTFLGPAMPGTFDTFGFDDFTIGTRKAEEPPTVIPEPTAALVWSMLGAIALAAGYRRRRLR